jgi:hypothetical protein
MDSEIFRRFEIDLFNAAKSLGMVYSDIFSVEEVAELMTELEYRCSVELIRNWMAARILPVVEDSSWTIRHVFVLSSALELRRCWATSPSRHDVKKSKARLAKEALPADDLRRTLDEMSLYDDAFLICMIAQGDESEREQLAELLLARIDWSTCRFRPHPEHQGV